jgi:hypothetical protein
LLWLAADTTVLMFDGRNPPVDISPGAYPYLRRITPGTEKQTVAAYFNWLERDWYVLLAAVDGSTIINRMFFFAFNKALGTDALQSVEVFVSDIPARYPAPGDFTWIGVVTTSQAQRKLFVGASGFMQEIPASSDTVNGLTLDQTITPPQFDNAVPPQLKRLNAYWRSGYFGNDSPQRSKLWRWLRIVTDQAAQAFQATLRYVDDEARTFLLPEIQGPLALALRRLGLNRKAKRLSVEIQFPPEDVASNVIELQVAAISTADR